VAALAVVSAPEGAAEIMGRTLLVGEAGVRAGGLSPALDPAAETAARAALAAGEPRLAEIAPGVEVFVDVLLPPLTLIVVGGVHITQALLPIARALGYRTIVVEPRSAFAQPERFASGSVDQIVTTWPDEALAQVGLTRSTAVAMLTHDPKLDDPALRAALPSPAFYVGALGSRTTQARRRQRLLEAGLTEAHLARLHGPIGLDLGARTPAEIALAIMAEIVAARNGK
jgi:xanthine dehydrogenase accessory factor